MNAHGARELDDDRPSHLDEPICFADFTDACVAWACIAGAVILFLID